MKKLLVAALLAVSSPALADTFNLSTLNEVITGSGNRRVFGPFTTGPNNTGTVVFSSTVNQVNPWTVGSTSLNFSWPGVGNQGGKTYMTAGAQFPIPTGQSLGQNQSGFSGEFQTNNGFPVYFAFSNPTYDGTIGGCQINCATITGVPVTLNSFWTTGNVNGAVVTGYSDLGHTVIAGDTMTLSGTGLQQIAIGWAGVEYVSITGGTSWYLNDIQVNDPVLSAVPEPSTWAMILLGFAGLGFAFRQSRRRVSL